ncbi:MAG: NADH-quinone oxidoreductase subunit L [Dehalococcoidia bacterium]|nr:NADH-quinone oxidoreductase subunit L [Dehalococcoidia bacterium]
MGAEREDACGAGSAEQDLSSIPEAAVWAIYFAPVTAFLVNAAFLRRRPQQAGQLTIAAVGLAWLLSLWALQAVMAHHGESVGFAPHTWLEFGDLHVELGVQLDGLTAMMLVVVTSVALLVQIYSTGYMHGDTGYARYYTYMALFTSAMLGLVLASSILQLFIHWELVGLASYLLIGFWFDRPAAAAAAKKAFIVTRFGDFGLMLAVIAIWANTKGQFNIEAINTLAEHGGLTTAALTGISLGMFMGAMGKSAQFPLHIWLPDAMEGPTPVSALIHAATMVVAGVYLLARMFPTFHAAPEGVHTFIAYTGAFTAIFAASMGLVMTDVKRVLAYSTVSQLGYMVMALGLGGYVAATFHLFTHAFFKALLFLGSGSVNHATNTFDMRLMGGLRKSMPITFWTFLIGSLSLSGVWPLSGFFSKDEILLDAWHEDKFLWVIGTLVAFMTAFYMFRAVFLTFFGEYKGGAEPEHGAARASPGGAHAGPRESPRSMAWPLIILAVPSVIIGFATVGWFGEFVSGALPPDLRHEVEPVSTVVVASLAAALGGIGLATAIYWGGVPSPAMLLSRFAVPNHIISNKYYMDTIAEDGIIRLGLDRGLGRGLQLFDTWVIDGAVNGLAFVVRMGSEGLRRTIYGQPQAYTSMFLMGAITIVGAVLVLGGTAFDALMELRP